MTVPLDQLLAESQWVRNLALSLVRDHQTADDVVQEAYLRALASPPREATRIRAWFRTVVRNVVTSRYRSESRRRRREETVAARPEVESSTELVEQVDQQRFLAAATCELEEPYREVILLRFFRDYSSREIAAQLNIPDSTVRVRISRGLDKLRERLDREYRSRDEWVLALLPLARLAPGSATGLTSRGISAASLFGSGAAFMTLCFKLAVPLLIVGPLIFLWQRESSEVDSATRERTPNSSLPPIVTDTTERQLAGASEKQAETENASGGVRTSAADTPSLRYSGFVYSSSGRALPEVTIQWLLPFIGDLKMSRPAGAPNPDGSFVISTTSTAAELNRAELEFAAPGHETKRIPLRALQETTERDSVFEVELFAERTIRGRVTDLEGRGIGGAEVSLTRGRVGRGIDSEGGLETINQWSRAGSTTSGASGDFEFRTFDADQYSVEVRASGFSGPVVRTIENVDLRKEWTIQLKPSTGMRGRVLFADGTPAAGAEVSFYSNVTRTAGIHLTTDDRGEFASDETPPGAEVLISINHPEAEIPTGERLPVKAEYEFVLDYAARLRIELQGEALPDRLRVERVVGRFIDYEEVEVVAGVIEWNRLRAGPGELQLRDGSQATPWIAYDLKPRQTETILATLEPLTKIELFVQTADEEPIRDVRVALIGPSRTDDLGQGRLLRRLTLPTGELKSADLDCQGGRLLLEAAGYDPAWIELDPFLEELDPDAPNPIVATLQPETILEFMINGPGAALAEGLAIGFTSFTPRVSAWIHHSERFKEKRSQSPDTVFTDSVVHEGRVVVRGLPAGRYIFSIGAGDRLVATWEQFVEASETQTITVERPAELELRGHVAIDGERMQSGILSFYRLNPAFRTEVKIESDLDFEVTVPEGYYWINYRSEDQPGTLGYQFNRRLQASDEDLKSLRLAVTTSRVEGQIVDHENVPVASQALEIYHKNRGRFPLLTDAQGHFTLDRVPPGQYGIWWKYTYSGAITVPAEPTTEVVIQLSETAR